MSEPLWERIQRLLGQLSESLDEAPRPVREERDLAERIRRELHRYEQHRAELSPPDRERLLEFVVGDLLGLARAYAPFPAAREPADAADPARALRLVMDAGTVLSGSLEYEATLDRLAHLSVATRASAAAAPRSAWRFRSAEKHLTQSRGGERRGHGGTHGALLPSCSSLCGSV